jgi:hypothetical protein
LPLPYPRAGFIIFQQPIQSFLHRRDKNNNQQFEREQQQQQQNNATQQTTYDGEEKGSYGGTKKEIHGAKGEVEEEQGQKSSLQIYRRRPSPTGWNRRQRAIHDTAA